jgi:hypothetical protein
MHASSGHLTARTDKNGFASFTGLSLARSGRYRLLVTMPGQPTSAAVRANVLPR